MCFVYLLISAALMYAALLGIPVYSDHSRSEKSLNHHVNTSDVITEHKVKVNDKGKASDDILNLTAYKQQLASELYTAIMVNPKLLGRRFAMKPDRSLAMCDDVNQVNI